MAVDAAAYAVLGLQPEAEWTSVERAYRTLIKAHHPDRPGGDAERAAEIIHAYRQLRQARSTRVDELDTWVEPEPLPEPRRSGRWFGAALAVAAAVVLLVLLTDPVGGLIEDFRMRAGPGAAAARTLPSADPDAAMAEPLDQTVIHSGVAEAVRVAATGNEAAMAQASRACEGSLRVQPSMALFDRCAALDDAIVDLREGEPSNDESPFADVAVTGRQMSGGGLLSDDYMAIESRLGRIRLEVKMALAPIEAQGG